MLINNINTLMSLSSFIKKTSELIPFIQIYFYFTKWAYQFRAYIRNISFSWNQNITT
jgi:hypothetical protein